MYFPVEAEIHELIVQISAFFEVLSQNEALLVLSRGEKIDLVHKPSECLGICHFTVRESELTLLLYVSELLYKTVCVVGVTLLGGSLLPARLHPHEKSFNIW